MKLQTRPKQVSALLVLLFVACLIAPFKGQKAFAQATGRGEVIVTLNPITPVTEDLAPKDYRFELMYNVSSYFLNTNNTGILLTFPQGILGWTYGNHSIYNVALSDNLGHYFDPIFGDDKVSNPEAQVMIPGGYEYRISLSFSTNYGVMFDEEKMVYELAISGTSASQTLSLRLPENFTLLECTPNATQEKDGKYTTFKWQQEAHSVFATFVPFHLQGTVRAFSFALDIASVTPVGVVKGTFEETFTTPKSFNIWQINPLFAINIPFPGYAQVLSVSKVWDGIGPCSEIAEPPENLDNNSLGHYYIDNANRTLIIYPRYDYKGAFYQYAVGAILLFPPEYRPFEMKAVKKLSPYRYESYFIINKVLVPANWNMNITGNVEIKFILPVGAQILKEESGNPEVDFEDGRTIGLFVSNSPVTLSPSGWHIIYEMTNEKTLFVIGVLTLLIFGIATILFLVLPSRVLQHVATVLGFGGFAVLIMGLNIEQFISINDPDPVFLYLISGEIALLSASVIILGWKSWNHLKYQKANQCPNCGKTGRYVRSRLTRKHFVKEYECSSCGEIILQKAPWKSKGIVHACETCDEKDHRIYQIQTGKFRNETGKAVDAQVECPKCGSSTWIRIQLEKEK
jgi:DNA-directed RNA polymerase subunit RPC12/RpoP